MSGMPSSPSRESDYRGRPGGMKRRTGGFDFIASRILEGRKMKSVIGPHTGDLRTSVRPSIGAENLIPEEVNDSKIAIRVAVMNKVQLLLAFEPRKPLKP